LSTATTPQFTNNNNNNNDNNNTATTTPLTPTTFLAETYWKFERLPIIEYKPNIVSMKLCNRVSLNEVV